MKGVVPKEGLFNAIVVLSVRSPDTSTSPLANAEKSIGLLSVTPFCRKLMAPVARSTALLPGAVETAPPRIVAPDRFQDPWWRRRA